MKTGNQMACTFAAAITIVVVAARANADIQPITFDLGPDNVFTVGDATAQGMSVTPSQYGTLGRFNAGNLLCIGPNNSVAGTGNPIGLFNVDSTGAFSTPMTFSVGYFLDGSAGATGWGVISGNAPTRGLVDGTYNLGFRTSLGNFGWMSLTLNENGTPKTVIDDIITINGSYVESVVGQGITVGVVPEPVSVLPVALVCVGLATWRWGRRGRAKNG